MEVKQGKKCNVCKTKATCLCFKCLSYYCENCYKLAHDNDENKNHTKEKIDYFVPIDLKCPEHNLVPMNLFCIDEKGKPINFNI